MARKKSALLALLPLLSLIFGCLEYGPARGPEGGSILLTLHASLSLAMIACWYWLDARSRGRRPSILLSLAMLLFTVVTLPGYLFRTRGLSGGLKAIALALLLFVGTMLAYHVGAWFA